MLMPGVNGHRRRLIATLLTILQEDQLAIILNFKDVSSITITLKEELASDSFANHPRNNTTLIHLFPVLEEDKIV